MSVASALPSSQSAVADAPLSYAAVGATQAPDLLEFPPRGFRPIERRARIGSGAERFEIASARLLAWGVQRGSGIAVDEIEPPAPTSTDYAGLDYAADGTPLGPRSARAEQAYSDDGTPLVSPGTTARLTIPAYGLRFTAPVRVVYLLDEPGRRGFAYGTLPGHPESGEELFAVEHRADDSVWVVIRAFSRPSSWLNWAAYPLLRLQQWRYTRRYLRSLSPARGVAGR